MPYGIFEENGKFLLYKVGTDGKKTGSALGEHETKEKAEAQRKALYAADNKALPSEPEIDLSEGRKDITGVSMSIDTYDGETGVATLRVHGSSKRPNWLETILNVFTRLTSGENDALANLKEKAVQDIQNALDDGLTSGFKMIGDNHWYAFYSNAAKDYSGEYFPMSETDAYIDRVDKGIVPKPELWYWHVPGTKHGATDWIGRVGIINLAVGHFDKTPIADAFKANYRKNSKQLSHGFYYVKSQRRGGVYGYYDTFEISPLPPGEADNPHTVFDLLNKEGQVMDNEKKARELAAILGEANAAAILGKAAQASKELIDKGVSFKAADAETDEEKKKKAEMEEMMAKKETAAASSASIDQKLDALITGMKALIDFQVKQTEAATKDNPVMAAIGQLTASVKELTEFTKGQYQMQPRATQAANTIVSDADPLLQWTKQMQGLQGDAGQKQAFQQMGAFGPVMDALFGGSGNGNAFMGQFGGNGGGNAGNGQ